LPGCGQAAQKIALTLHIYVFIKSILTKEEKPFEGPFDISFWPFGQPSAEPDSRFGSIGGC